MDPGSQIPAGTPPTATGDKPAATGDTAPAVATTEEGEFPICLIYTGFYRGILMLNGEWIQSSLNLFQSVGVVLLNISRGLGKWYNCGL